MLRAYSIAPQVIEPDKYAGGFINFLRAIDRADATEVRLRSE